jgi:amino acid transporter
MRRALGVGLGVIAAVFIIQGFGVAQTGSTMDGAPFWGFVGLAMMVAAVSLAFKGQGISPGKKTPPTDGQEPGA